MKKIYYLPSIVLLLVTSLFISSCKDDDGAGPVIATTMVDGEKFNLHQVFLELDSVGGENLNGDFVYIHHIGFYNNGDSGGGVSVNFICSSNLGFESGAYEMAVHDYLSQFEDEEFREASSTLTGEVITDFTQGSLAVTKDGDIYQIDISLSGNGHAVDLSFKGRVQYW